MLGIRWDCLRDPPCSCPHDPPDRDEGALSLSTGPRGRALTVLAEFGGAVAVVFTLGSAIAVREHIHMASMVESS